MISVRAVRVCVSFFPSLPPSFFSPSLDLSGFNFFCSAREEHILFWYLFDSPLILISHSRPSFPPFLPSSLPPSFTVESARRLLPSQFEEDDFLEQEQMSKHARREGGREDREEALPSGGGEETMPVWLFSLVCFVVVVAFAVKN